MADFQFPASVGVALVFTLSLFAMSSPRVRCRGTWFGKWLVCCGAILGVGEWLNGSFFLHAAPWVAPTTIGTVFAGAALAWAIVLLARRRHPALPVQRAERGVDHPA